MGILLPLSGLPHVKISNWFEVDWATVEWLPFLNVMFWWAPRFKLAFAEVSHGRMPAFHATQSCVSS